jgi:tRNA modification GTPase
MAPADTIFALASAPGRAGVAVIRLSGPLAGLALEKLTGRVLPPPRLASVRKLRALDATILDEALVLWFPAPGSFTGEDVAELHLHGGRAVLQGVTTALQQLGLRLAEPGEFSRRAFEHGKLDLTEAEAIADLVNAETEAQRRQALRQLQGELGNLYRGWAAQLTRILAYQEAAIDFADEDLPQDLAVQQQAALANLQTAIAAHLNDNQRGERLRDGFTIAILGPPNAGKSSLLNALARREAAIVSPIAGTTRDIIEVQLDLGGYPVTLADTAGLRETADAVESEGIRRALQRAESADLKILVLDGSQDSTLEETVLGLADGDCVIVLNKSDLLRGEQNSSPASCPRRRASTNLLALSVSKPQHSASSQETINLVDARLRGHDAYGAVQAQEKNLPMIYVSTLTGQGMSDLTQRLIGKIEQRYAPAAQPSLTRARHRAALQECQEHLSRAKAGREAALIAEDTRLALRALGRITGTVDVEDLLDVIFRDFCIGK